MPLIDLTCEWVGQGRRDPVTRRACLSYIQTGPKTWIDIDIVHQYFVILIWLSQNSSDRWRKKTVAYIYDLKTDPGVWTNLGNVVLAYLLQHLRLQKTNKNAQRAPIPIIFTYLIFFPGLEKNWHCERKWWHEYYIMNLHFLAQPALWYWMRMDTIFNCNVFLPSGRIPVCQGNIYIFVFLKTLGCIRDKFLFYSWKPKQHICALYIMKLDWEILTSASKLMISQCAFYCKTLGCIWDKFLLYSCKAEATRISTLLLYHRTSLENINLSSTVIVKL